MTDFAPVARENEPRFTVMPTSVYVRSDPNLLRRLIQNLVSNAIKYTREGRVLVGVRRRGDKVIIQVIDTGIGIPTSKFRTVFREFARLEEGARTASGLGLGLSIVDRIAQGSQAFGRYRVTIGQGDGASGWSCRLKPTSRKRKTSAAPCRGRRRRTATSMVCGCCASTMNPRSSKA
jgi:K+-sensing histidine kinase KdpD